MQQNQKYYQDQSKIIADRVKELEKQIASEEKKNKKLKKQRKQM
jgi:cell division protein FtsB